MAAPPMGPKLSLTLRIRPMVLLQSKMANIPSAVARVAGENENIQSSQLIGIHCVIGLHCVIGIDCVAVLV